jgi:hypothetical protein
VEFVRRSLGIVKDVTAIGEALTSWNLPGVRPKNRRSRETEQGEEKHYQLPPIDLALCFIFCNNQFFSDGHGRVTRKSTSADPEYRDWP